jgi:hypothetical protein
MPTFSATRAFLSSIYIFILMYLLPTNSHIITMRGIGKEKREYYDLMKQLVVKDIKDNWFSSSSNLPFSAPESFNVAAVFENQLLYQGENGKLVYFTSIPRNFIQECILPLEYKRGTFYSFMILPSLWERVRIGWLPISRTLTSPKMAVGMVMNKEEGTIWSKISEPSWVLPINHIRQSRAKCVSAIRNSSKYPIVLHNRNVQAPPWYLLYLRYAVVHPSGVVIGDTGRFQSQRTCDTHAIYNRDYDRLVKQCNKLWGNDDWGQYFERFHGRFSTDDFVNSTYQLSLGDFYKNCDLHTFSRYDSVFVASSYEDSNYYHFMTGGMLRLVRAIPWLVANPHIKIHLGHRMAALGPNKFYSPAVQHNVLAFFNISSSRIISGFAFARQVFLPRSVGCDEPEDSANELRALSVYMRYLASIMSPTKFDPSFAAQSEERLRRSQKQEEAFPSHSVINNTERSLVRPKTTYENNVNPNQLVLLSRIKEWDTWTIKEYDFARATQGKRSWSAACAKYFLETLSEKFSSFDSVVHLTESSSNQQGLPNASDFCIGCRVNLLSKTNVYVGAHGAGLTNVIFMPPGSLLVEIVMKFSGVSTPLCGSFGRLCNVLGIHHLSLYHNSMATNFTESDALRVASVAQRMWYEGVADNFRSSSSKNFF